jgi:hypothetical protein
MRSKKNKEHMSIFRQDESPDASTAKKENDKLRKKIFRNNESLDASTAKKEKDKLRKEGIRNNESPLSSAVRKIIDKTSKKRKRQSCQQDAVNVHDDKEMKRSVERAIKEAKNILHRTQNHQAPRSHRAIVCIICDCFINGIETIHKLKIDQIAKHRERLSVKRGILRTSIKSRGNTTISSEC